MGQAFDLTRSYTALLTQLAIVTLGVAALMLFLPRYDSAPRSSAPMPAPTTSPR